MKKSLLIVIAALFVAIGANAQGMRISSAQKSEGQLLKSERISVPANRKSNDCKIQKVGAPMNSRRAIADIAGTYILNYLNWDGDFTSSSEFSIVEENGTITLDQVDVEEGASAPTFDYNIKLVGFTDTRATVYGFYSEEDKYITIPVQTAFTYSTYGPIVFSALVEDKDGEPYSYGYSMGLIVEEDGSLTIDEGDFSEAIEAGQAEEGIYIGGFWNYMPEYLNTSGYPYRWNMGKDIELFTPNAIQGGVEVHIVSGSWGNWTRTSHNVYVEDYGSEIVVHNFFGLCPISISIEGNKASIATPVRVEPDDYAEEGEDPNYIMINQWDENFENILNPGLITGNVTVDTDGTKYIEFYDTEYKEAWTDEDGTEHEAGNYIINDYTKWFMVHSTWGENGAYWWGEARNVYVAIPNAEVAGISNVKTTAKSNVKTYNLMGQEVNASAKGLIIRDGKKMLNK